MVKWRPNGRNGNYFDVNARETNATFTHKHDAESLNTVFTRVRSWSKGTPHVARDIGACLKYAARTTRRCGYMAPRHLCLFGRLAFNSTSILRFGVARRMSPFSEASGIREKSPPNEIGSRSRSHTQLSPLRVIMSQDNMDTENQQKLSTACGGVVHRTMNI